MKLCPYCAEEIQDTAIKCKHCGEFIDGATRAPSATEPTSKWYFGTLTVVVALLCVGPFALPLIWWNPGVSRTWKIAFTAIVLISTVLLTLASIKSLTMLNETYSELMRSM